MDITHKPKVLLVEDNDVYRKVIKNAMVLSGFDALEAENGLRGLEIARLEKPDLILADVYMPVMDGMTMLRELRKDSWGRNVKVVLLTNLSEADRADESFEQGVYDYLVKSDWKLEDIVNKVKGKLGITT